MGKGHGGVAGGAFSRTIQRSCGNGIVLDLDCDSASILVMVLKCGFARHYFWG